MYGFYPIDFYVDSTPVTVGTPKASTITFSSNIIKATGVDLQFEPVAALANTDTCVLKYTSYTPNAPASYSANIRYLKEMRTFII